MNFGQWSRGPKLWARSGVHPARICPMSSGSPAAAFFGAQDWRDMAVARSEAPADYVPIPPTSSRRPQAAVWRPQLAFWLAHARVLSRPARARSGDEAPRRCGSAPERGRQGEISDADPPQHPCDTHPQHVYASASEAMQVKTATLPAHPQIADC